MNFRSRFTHRTDGIEINVIPLIDVLLVVLIFFAATTTFTTVNELHINLPASNLNASAQEANLLAISHDGQYALNGQLLSGTDPQQLQQALSSLPPHQALIIYADALSPHASVVRVMEAAQQSQIAKISFATRHTP